MSNNGAEDKTQYETLLELVQGKLYDQIASFAKETILNNKKYLYEIFWAKNTNIDRDKLNALLLKEENRRLTVSFNDGDERWTLTLSNVKIVTETEEEVRAQKGV